MPIITREGHAPPRLPAEMTVPFSTDLSAAGLRVLVHEPRDVAHTTPYAAISAIGTSAHQAARQPSATVRMPPSSGPIRLGHAG